MLVLSRKAGEAIVIGENIEISILEVRGDVVSIGIEAPRDVRVWRKELWLETAQENKRAVAPTALAKEAEDILRQTLHKDKEDVD